MRMIIVSAIVGIGMAMVAVPARSGEFDLQAAIDQANPGDLIQVPAGAYQGNYKLKEGVVLVGAGAASTVLGLAPTATSIDTTASYILDARVTWSVAAAGNKIGRAHV